MDNNDFIALYNPANAANLTAEQIDAMGKLTDEQIDALAKAYPNTPHGGLYLMLWDDHVKPEKQFYQMSSWQNLRNLRKFNGGKNFRAFTFKSRFTPAAKTHKEAAAGLVRKPSNAGKVVVDLTAKEAADDLRRTLAAKKADETTDANGQGNQTKKQTGGRKTTKVKATEVQTPTPDSTTTTSQEVPLDQQEDDPTGESEQG